MKGLKKNLGNPKGSKNASLNSKLSEDMVQYLRYSKTRSKMPLLSMTQETQDTSTARTSEAFLVTLLTPK